MPPRLYVCHRSPEPLRVDGDLSKPAWSVAPWTDDFVDIEGSAKPKPRFRTRAKMLWDDKFLYIGAELEEPQVWATLKERDSILFLDNDFELFIDPDGDNHHYVELEINAFGTIWDLLMPRPYRDGGMPLMGWQFKGIRTGVKVDGVINDPSVADQGWSVEIAIPWRSIKEVCRTECPPLDGQQWRVNFSRVEWDVEVVEGCYRKVDGRPEQNWVWSPQGVVDLHRPEHWGVVQFSSTPATSELLPTPSLEPQEVLHQLYYRQRDFRNSHGRWAQNLNELSFEPNGYAIEVLSTSNYFEAILRTSAGEDWHIGSDSHFWKGESYESKCVRGECEFRPDFGSSTIDF